MLPLGIRDVHAALFLTAQRFDLAIKVGQQAEVYLDSNPKQSIPAEVIRVDPEAMFTPENTYFKDDRVKQVLGLKLGLRGAYGFAKPGMPADGRIQVGAGAQEQAQIGRP